MFTGFLARRKIDVVDSLRSGELLPLIDRPPPTIQQRRGTAARNVALIDSLFVEHPERGAVLRAMLLSDRSFVDSGVVLAFQKTAAYHLLVVVGLRVGCEFLLPGDIEKKLKMSWSPRGTPCRAFSESSASWEQDVLDRCVRRCRGVAYCSRVFWRRQPVRAFARCCCDAVCTLRNAVLTQGSRWAVTALTDGHDSVLRTFVEEHPQSR